VQVFRDVGFAHVESEDRTQQFVEMLTKELHFVETNVQSLVAVSHVLDRIATGNESVPIQLAQCWFPRLAISDASKIYIYFSSKIHESNFIERHSETVTVRN